jgi:hypothetical protein
MIIGRCRHEPVSLSRGRRPERANRCNQAPTCCSLQKIKTISDSRRLPMCRCRENSRQQMKTDRREMHPPAAPYQLRPKNAGVTASYSHTCDGVHYSTKLPKLARYRIGTPIMNPPVRKSSRLRTVMGCCWFIVYMRSRYPPTRSLCWSSRLCPALIKQQ